ncbi:class I SAM-dependent methyltransferase [Bhargavaea ginsengi]|uniref:class I SAM-dependent methyltransferase n=1 Tax=Bhargavaea ginsengi TaxID=426757 RepID=UPI00203A83AF|nr:class I SAM-dependent methyltransferase [Bhargavaea ginsengi]MCM3086763.1 class I SAM-dependent methyltransferase [Bhargavaea ginsengi]
MTATDNLEKYNDPLQYDREYGGYDADVQFILGHLPPPGSAVIDLACGTGRISLPVAAAGYEVTGVDLHEGMLARAREKAAEQGLSVRFLQQDGRALDLPVSAPLIVMAGNSFQHFLMNEDQDRMLESVRRHLEPGGRFIFDTRNPVPSELAEPDRYEEYAEAGGRRIQEVHTETYEPVTQILHCTTERFAEDGTPLGQDGISLRYTYPLELERLLRQHSFRLENRYGDWSGRPFQAGSGQMVCVCRRDEP